MDCKRMPEVMHTGALVVSLKRDAATVEHLAEELVHGIGMDISL